MMSWLTGKAPERDNSLVPVSFSVKHDSKGETVLVYGNDPGLGAAPPCMPRWLGEVSALTLAVLES